MKAIVVGSGAGGATAARELQSKGFEVLVLEAGPPFKPLQHGILATLRLWTLRRYLKHIFPPMDIRQLPTDIVREGLDNCGHVFLPLIFCIRADRGLKEIGLDLTPEYDELEGELKPITIPEDNWRPVTKEMFRSAQDLGLNPQRTPKVVDTSKCNNCGLCELGCVRGARWDSRKFLTEAIRKGAVLKSKSPVEKVITENGRVTGVMTRDNKKYNADVVVLAAGGIGSPQILKNSGLKSEDHLWADIVLTMGGVLKDARQLEEPPMAWYTQEKDYILSPYPDILSHYFHKPWRNVPIQDRVGLMVKLADTEEGTVYANGKVDKPLTAHDHERLDLAINQAQEVMEGAGVSGPFIRGVPNGGHLGGTVPLMKEDVANMRPSWLPGGLWVADLSLAPSSQGLPTILLTAALALRVARNILKNCC